MKCPTCGHGAELTLEVVYNCVIAAGVDNWTFKIPVGDSRLGLKLVDKQTEYDFDNGYTPQRLIFEIENRFFSLSGRCDSYGERYWDGFVNEVTGKTKTVMVWE